MGVVTDGIRTLNELKLREGSLTVEDGLLSVELITIARGIRYVCRVRLSNLVDLHLRAAGLSCEFSSFWILVLEY